MKHVRLKKLYDFSALTDQVWSACLWLLYQCYISVLVNVIVCGRVNADCTHLDLVHKTAVDEVPSAIAPFQGRILVGVGCMLHLYDMGRKKLLRKCENKV
jgi:hypothetical protein